MFEKQITGYCDRLCAAPGESIGFKVSCEQAGSYRADIVRIFSGDDHLGGPGLREELLQTNVSGEYLARYQPTFPGSAGVIPQQAPFGRIASFTVAAMAFPTTPRGGAQVLISHWSDAQSCGFELRINAQGCLELALGNGQAIAVVNGQRSLAARRWCLVAATYDAASHTATLHHAPQALSAGADWEHKDEHLTVELDAEALVAPHSQGLSFAARWRIDVQPRPRGQFHYNGKLDSPRLLDVAVGQAQLLELFQSHIPAQLRTHVIGWWDFSQDIASEKITDLSGHNLHGYTTQLPGRGVTGFNWDGTEHNWRHAPQQYGAIYFHDDDLIDAQWEDDFCFVVPGHLASGVYAARIRQDDPAGDDYITFVVRPPRGTAQARILYLLPTASYLAYSNSRLHLRPSKLFGAGDPEYVNDAFLQRHPEFGSSLYDMHSDRSGIMYASYLRPVQNLKPRHNRPWCFPADTTLVDWLDRGGFDFDVLTDEELHHEGLEALRRYTVVLTGSHPEYHSTAMLDALDSYLRAGGRLMYLGGNGFYWRIAFHPTRPGTIEVRRAEDGTRAWIAEPGEYYQSFNGEYGGLWRRLGRAPNRLVGIGFAAQGFDRSSYYRKQPGADHEKAAFVFAGVPEEIIGDFGSIGGGAAGEEIDRFDLFLGSPPNAIVLASSENHDASMLRTKEEFLSTVPAFDDPKIRADMVLFETSNGGAVFSTGSITWIASLSHNDYDNNVARITQNVLCRFVDSTPL